MNENDESNDPNEGVIKGTEQPTYADLVDPGSQLPGSNGSGDDNLATDEIAE